MSQLYETYIYCLAKKQLGILKLVTFILCSLIFLKTSIYSFKYCEAFWKWLESDIDVCSKDTKVRNGEFAALHKLINVLLSAGVPLRYNYSVVLRTTSNYCKEQHLQDLIQSGIIVSTFTFNEHLKMKRKYISCDIGSTI